MPYSDVSKILYVILNHEGVNDVCIGISVINIHILQFVILKKVLEEAVIILLVVIIFTINPAQVPQGKDVIPIVSVPFTAQIFQISALVHVRYFNTYCR